MKKVLPSCCFRCCSFPCCPAEEAKTPTEVSIVGEMFCINGEPTFKGRIWNGYKIEGLLPNSRMVQGILTT